MVELRLDSNIIFYETRGDGKYNLVDKFAVNGGQDIVLHMGTWDNSNGVQLEKRTNRWDRRTDLKGAKFVSTFDADKRDAHAYHIYNNEGEIVGSGGTIQEKLFYMTALLNMTIDTRDSVMLIKGEPAKVRCARLLDKKLTDMCSARFASTSINLSKGVVIVITERPRRYTLHAGVSEKSALDAWAYTEVFGMSQWLLYTFALIATPLAMLLAQILLDGDRRRILISDGVAMALLFFIQKGDHTGDEKHLAIRIMSLTMALLTLVMFIYYSNDITAKMTAGSPPHPVRNFEDVLDKGYRVIVLDWRSTSLGLLKQSKVGTAKNTVYKRSLEEDLTKIFAWRNATLQGNLEVAERIELPVWHLRTTESERWAIETVIRDKKTLWYTFSGTTSSLHENSGKLVELRMDDTNKRDYGPMLRQDSEYLPLFRHYALKGFETGIFKRIDLMRVKHCVELDNEVCWPDSRPPIKIGMTEPGALAINNVMFPFSLLAAAIFVSLVAVIMEEVNKTMNTLKEKNREVRLINSLGQQQSCLVGKPSHMIHNLTF